MGMFLSVTCSEDIPLIRREDIAGETKGTFLGPAVIESLSRACERWPRGNLPPAYNDPVRSNLPVLILSGEVDPVAPPSWGAEIAQYLPNSLHVVMNGVAHGPLPDCAGDIMTQFLSKGSIKDLDTTCVKELRRPPFAVP